MDTAAAARMSDPDRNPNFRRRWREPAGRAPAAPAEPADRPRGDRLARLADLLRAEWRRRRGGAAGGGP
jgi:hypothetical protein